MRVDEDSLGAILKNVKSVEQGNFDFAVEAIVDQDNILPMLSVEGVGVIPVPVSIKDMNRLKKISDEAVYCQKANTKGPGKVKKTCWQIDASKIENADSFFWQTIPSLAADGLRKLAFDDSDIALVEACPKSVLICEKGGSYPLQHDVEEPRVFATMILQIPVKNGYSGGCLKIKHRSQIRLVDHSNESKERFFTTIYYVGCEHELTEIANGWRLVLVFNLVWKWPRSLFMPLPDDQSIVLAAQEIERLLSPWRLPDQAQQRLLALPLDHTYTKTSLSFSGLKGLDRLTASLLRSVGFVDLHLAGIRRRMKPIDNSLSNGTDVQEADKEELYTESWIAACTDSNFALHGLEIDFDSELILPINHSEANAGNQESNKLVSNAEISTDFLYHEVMLVVWPRTSTIDFACRFGFVAALDLLEFLVLKLSKEEVMFVLGRTVAFCCAHPRCVWGSSRQVIADGGDVTYRLLQLCIDLKASNQGLILLNLLAEDLPPNPKCEESESPVEYEGIQTTRVAIALSKLIQLAGWKSCCEAIGRLLTPTRIAAQLESMVALVLSLMNEGLINNAIEVADRVCPILFSSPANQKPSVTNYAAEMIFRLEEWTEKRNPQRVNNFLTMAQCMETDKLCPAILHVHKTLPQLIKRIIDIENLYRYLCLILVQRQDLTNIRSTSVNGDSIFVDLIKCFFWFNDDEILQLFIRQLVKQTNGNNAPLQAVVWSDSVWDASHSSTDGGKVLYLLIDCRLRELSLLKPPVFSWEQPDAVVPNYPEIEAFLRSNQLSTTFSRKFANVCEARQWAIEVFGFSYNVLASPDSSFFHQHRYSATVHLKKIGGGFIVCEITKNRRLYEFTVRQFQLRQREVGALIERRRSGLSAQATSRQTKRVKFDLP